MLDRGIEDSLLIIVVNQVHRIDSRKVPPANDTLIYAVRSHRLFLIHFELGIRLSGSECAFLRRLDGGSLPVVLG